MKLKYVRDIKDNIMTTSVMVESLGNASYTAEEEKTLLDNMPRYIEFKALTWTGKYNIDGSGNVIKDDTTGDSIILQLINKKILLDENFKADFSIAVKDVPTSALTSKLTTKELVCEADCRLFEDVITKAVQDVLTELRNKDNDFESGNSVIL